MDADVDAPEAAEAIAAAVTAVRRREEAAGEFFVVDGWFGVRWVRDGDFGGGGFGVEGDRWVLRRTMVSGGMEEIAFGFPF
jgi:hypothetical protein